MEVTGKRKKNTTTTTKKNKQKECVRKIGRKPTEIHYKKHRFIKREHNRKSH